MVAQALVHGVAIRDLSVAAGNADQENHLFTEGNTANTGVLGVDVIGAGCGNIFVQREVIEYDLRLRINFFHTFSPFLIRPDRPGGIDKKRFLVSIRV